MNTLATGKSPLRFGGTSPTFSVSPNSTESYMVQLSRLEEKDPKRAIEVLQQINLAWRQRLLGKMVCLSSLSRADLHGPSRGDVLNALDAL